MDRSYFDELLLGLTPDAVIHTDQTSAIMIHAYDALLQLELPSAALQAAIQALAAGPVRVGELAEHVLAQDGITGASFLYSYLGRLRQRGLLIYRLDVYDQPIATCIPQTCAFRLIPAEVAPYGYVLSRFAYVRREQQSLLIESSIGSGRVVVHDLCLLGLVRQLSMPCTLETFYAAAPQLTPEQVNLLIDMLWSCGALSVMNAQGLVAEDQQDHLRQWEFHDLLFHRLSRLGKHRNRFGATQRFAGAIAQPPKLKYYPADIERIVLDLPSAEAIWQGDITLDAALEGRCSLRTPGRPLTLAQLSTFLYRSARVRFPTQAETRSAGGPPKPEPPGYRRPYPGGGARYELELYLNVHRCDGLEPGLYHYQPLEHALARVRPYDAQVQRMLQRAMQSAAMPDTPDVLITLAACFQRMSWRYESMAYATILKDVGVLYQTMYLVATAMGLAPCALGYGDSALFSAAAGTDYYVESSVGEFMLSGGAAPRSSAGNNVEE